MNEIARVFFHELGHFVAHELNRLYFGGKPLKSFVVAPFDPDKIKYQGEVKLDLTEDEKLKVPSFDVMPQALAPIIYGSMFQAYFMKQSLNDAIKLNAEHDMCLRRAIILENNVIGCGSKFTNVENKYFENVLIKAPELAEFFNLNPMEYLVEDGIGRFDADLNKLQKNLQELLNRHFQTYSILIADYESVLDLARLGKCLDS